MQGWRTRLLESNPDARQEARGSCRADASAVAAALKAALDAAIVIIRAVRVSDRISLLPTVEARLCAAPGIQMLRPGSS